MKHKHAELMAEYAKDAFENETPWKLWEFCENKGTWSICGDHPCWNTTTQYRRKPIPPKPREWTLKYIQSRDHAVVWSGPPIEEGKEVRVREIIEE
jgi:hypothetical protein